MVAVGAMAAAAAAVGNENNLRYRSLDQYVFLPVARVLTRVLKELAQCHRGARGERGTAAIQNVAVRATPEHAGVAQG